ncbi:MAG: DEAD/DEAH box helicase, partial [Proteobacteria bacterium]|nr:DEAD/DEAH box helicase [Pseudomonadota bacterium]
MHSKSSSHRKGFGKPSPHRSSPPSVREQRPSPPQTVSPEAIAKSEAAIKTWLEAGVDLRNKQSASAGAVQDPKTLALDPWQQQVFELIRAGESVIVDAPTTAGKTRAVEVFFAQNLEDPTFRAAYTTPVKSLSNDKVREL